MSHSPAQQRQKAMARTEALDHAQHANVMMPRAGRDHEGHKVEQMHREDKMRGLGATNTPDDEGMSA